MPGCDSTVQVPLVRFKVCMRTTGNSDDSQNRMFGNWLTESKGLSSVERDPTMSAPVAGRCRGWSKSTHHSGVPGHCSSVCTCNFCRASPGDEISW